MTLGGRIDARLTALGWSQAQLARETGLPQTTVNSLVRGNARTTPHLIKLARALETTPAYLLGATDDPFAEFPIEALTEREHHLISMYRSVPKADQEQIYSTISHWSAPYKAGT